MKFVIYRRVSTKAQGGTRLGLDAQERACMKVIESAGGECIGMFTDIISGADKTTKQERRRMTLDERLRHRPELLEAIQLAEEHGATLIVHKLDRLARTQSLVTAILDVLDVTIAVDPDQDPMMTQLQAMFSEKELDTIRQRIRDAIESKVLRMHKEGNTDYKWGQEGGAVTKNKTRDSYQVLIKVGLFSVIEQCLQAGYKFKDIASELNAKGIKTVKGGSWGATQVSRVLKLFDIDYLAVKRGRSINDFIVC